jgi:AcrR family transcriptional regulator
MTAEGEKRGRPRNPEVDRAILVQTLRLLAEQGYAGMSIESVAAAAGVGKATLYRRYKDKRELVVATLSMLLREAPPLPDTGDVKRDLLTAATDALSRLQRMNGFSIIGTLLVEAEQNPEFLELFRRHMILPRRAALKGLLERGIQRGQLRRSVDTEAVVDCIIGSVLARHVSGLPMDEQWIQSVIRSVLEGAASGSVRPDP